MPILSLTLKLGESAVLDHRIRLTFAHAKRYSLSERGPLYRYEFFYLEPIEGTSKLVALKEGLDDNESLYIEDIDCHVKLVLNTRRQSINTLARLSIMAPREVSINRECIELLENMNFYSNYRSHVLSRKKQG